jgi:hypothetical protein
LIFEVRPFFVLPEKGPAGCSANYPPAEPGTSALIAKGMFCLLSYLGAGFQFLFSL